MPEATHPIIGKKYKEIFLYFCAECGTVRVCSRRLNDDEAGMMDSCMVCKKETYHAPVAVDFFMKLFITRV